MSGPRISLLKNPRSSGKFISFSVSFEEDSLKIIPTPYGHVIELDDCRVTGEQGAPGLPKKLLTVALPSMARPTKVTASIKSRVPVGTEPVFIAPVQNPRPAVIPVEDELTYLKKQQIKKSVLRTDEELFEKPIASMRPELPNPALYKSAVSKPVAVLLAASQIGTVSTANIEISPVRYLKDGRVEFCKDMNITVHYEVVMAGETGEDPDKLIPKYFKSIRTRSQAKRYTDLAKELVINPETIVDFSDYFLEPPISQLDYLIITDNNQWNSETITAINPIGDLKSAFQQLADWKKMKGLKAHVVTIEEIVNGTFGDFSICDNGLNARDLQEVIRNFIKWAHTNWGVEWVVLGGDVNIIPVRQVPGASQGHINVGTANPPGDNSSFWTGTYLRMNVVNPGEWWPGNTGRILVRPDTGAIIPEDTTGNSNAANPGWYYCTNNTYSTLSPAPTQFVRVNGPAALVNAQLQWIYQWNYIPTDLYYSSLVGPDYNIPGRHDWDLVNNELYGQHTNSTNLDGDPFDADVSLGRIPVSSVDQANAFVEKLIAYEQFRNQDGSLLNLDWPKKVTFVSSNFGHSKHCEPSPNNPPEEFKYYHQPGNNYSILNTKEPFTDYDFRVIARVNDADLRFIPHDVNAKSTGYGWFYSTSHNNPEPSMFSIVILGISIEFPIPTQWIAVYSSGGDLTPQSYILDEIGMDGSMFDMETLRKQMASDFPAVNMVTRMYQDEMDLPPADAGVPLVQHLTTDALRNNLNAGPHFLNLSGHGNSNGCCGLNGNMASNLTNGKHTFIAFAMSCLTNQFEAEDAMSERLIYNPNGGAIAYVGTTRFGWIGMGDDFHQAFYKTLKTTRHLGHLNDIRCTMANGTHSKWTAFSQNLLGDPEMPVWVGSPLNLNVSHPAEISNSSQTFTVTVTKSGSNVGNATVCLRMGGGFYATGKTNNLGIARLNINPPNVGIMEIVVTADNAIPYIGQVQVKETPPCGIAINCGQRIACSANIFCGPRLACGNAIIGCGTSINCGVTITCGTRIVDPCGFRIECGAALNPCRQMINCHAAIVEACPRIIPQEFDRFKDVLDLAKVKTFDELVLKAETAEVKEAIAMLPADKAKEVRLLIERLRAES